jgi:hypothetical protein
VLHFALFCGWGCAKLSLLIIGHSCAYVKFSQASHNPLPTVGLHDPSLLLEGSCVPCFRKLRDGVGDFNTGERPPLSLSLLSSTWINNVGMMTVPSSWGPGMGRTL